MRHSASDLDKINDEQRQFLSALNDFRPDFKNFCTAEHASDGSYNLRVEIPSPTGHSERDIFVWVEGDEISLEFGRWHTHANAQFETDKKGYYDEYSIIDVLKLIVCDELVYFVETGGKTSYSDVLYLRNKNAVADVLTDPSSPNEIEIRSWSGNKDRKVSLRNFSTEF